jgi:TPR repeat protein
MYMIVYPDELDLEEELRKADAGDGEAMMRAAFCILFTHPNEPLDQAQADRAIAYYKKAAELGYKTAMLDLGAAYVDGRGVERDIAKAMEWYKKGWDPEDAASCMCMGSMNRYDYLQDGTEVPTTDPARIADALYYFQLGAKLNDSDCLYELGEMYLAGTGVEKSEQKAFALFSEAADFAESELLNDRSAMLYWRLGLCYRYGWGTEKDPYMALSCLAVAEREWKRREEVGITDEQQFREQAKAEYDSLKREFNS